MILILDNYDSFVFNLARYLEELGQDIAVYRNDALSLTDIARLAPDAILLSPGPGRPDEAGIMLDLIRHFSNHVPILGICLGHQAIGQAFGCKIDRALEPMHGRASQLTHGQEGLFKTIPSPFTVGRYHSLIVQQSTETSDLIADAWSPAGEIMALHHKTHPTWGLQFHPESILTQHGHQLLKNFLEMANDWHHRNQSE